MRINIKKLNKALKTTGKIALEIIVILISRRGRGGLPWK